MRDLTPGEQADDRLLDLLRSAPADYTPADELEALLVGWRREIEVAL